MLGSDGQLVREEETGTEGNMKKEEVKVSKIDIEENREEKGEEKEEVVEAFEIDE